MVSNRDAKSSELGFVFERESGACIVGVVTEEVDDGSGYRHETRSSKVEGKRNERSNAGGQNTVVEKME